MKDRLIEDLINASISNKDKIYFSIVNDIKRNENNKEDSVMNNKRIKSLCVKCGDEIDDKLTICKSCIILEEFKKREEFKKALNHKHGRYYVSSKRPGLNPKFSTIETNHPIVNAIKSITNDINNKYRQINDVLDIQGHDGNWNFDNYMLGLFNGMEMIVSIMEDRDAAFRSCDRDKFLDKKTITLDKCTHINCDFNHADVCFLKKDADKNLCNINEQKERQSKEEYEKTIMERFEEELELLINRINKEEK